MRKTGYHPDWDECLQAGEIKETLIRHTLTGGSDSVTYEVKYDEQAHETGNLFIEVYSRGKQSGLSITTADWWFFVTDHPAIIAVPTSRLKIISRRYWELSGKKFKLGGDIENGVKTSKGILVPLRALVSPRESRNC
jgi:hypothetical protein